MSVRSPKQKRSVGTARQHQRRLKLLFEHLEDRRMLATYVVDHVGDSGVGSLRQAILDANANPGPDEIVFDISGVGQHTIQPLSALPNITDTVAIQGETQPGYSDRPLIAMDGSLIVSGTVSGLRLMAGSDGSSISGLSISAFQPSLIEIQSNSNLITSNFVGVRLDGSLPYASDGDGGVIGKPATTGVWIVGGADNQIGAPDQGNLISGSYNNVAIRDASAIGNRIQGNRIGTNEAGTAAISANYLVDRFSERGILIHQGAGETLIGGSQPGEGNLVSGHFGSSIEINVSSGSNLIVGNRVGTNAEGTARIGNTRGVGITNSPSDQILNNLLSGNVNAIVTQGLLTTDTVIQGNLVGTDVMGTQVIGNTGHAVFISNDTSETLIGGALPEHRNVIAGTSGGDAIIMRGSNHRIFGNYIGTDISGMVALGNSGIGVYLSSASYVQIGSSAPGTANVIAANGTGISVLSDSQHNRIQGNLIGTAVDGVTPLGNSIGIRMRASHNLIGTDGDGVDDDLEGNVIAASSLIGIELAAVNSESGNNVVAGNLIGTDKFGTTILANRDGIYIDSMADVRIGGLTTVERNIIAGSTRYGIHVQRQNDKRGVEILGNYIGTDITGTVAMANATAINIDRSAGVMIGSTLDAGRNTISGNQRGIVISGVGADGNQVIGNYIGTTPNGLTALGNAQEGVYVSVSARGNRIGGAQSGERNIISGNQNGVSLNFARETIIQGNWIGTDATGNSMLANSSSGVLIVGSADTLVGGSVDGTGNVIAGGVWGIYLNATASSVAATTDTLIQGNKIGTNVSGTAAMPNTYGIDISAPSWWWIHDTQVGGTEEGARNLISGSTNAAIRVRGGRVTGGWIAGNWIGTDVSGQSAIPNARGIVAESSAGGLTVGGPNAGNLISGNTQHGIRFTGDGPSTKLESFNSAVEANNAGWTEFGSRDSRDNFGFSSSNNNGGTAGFEAGGTFARASTGLDESYDPISYYADTRLGGELSLESPLHAQGSLIVTEADRWNQNIRLGYFNRAAAETEMVGHAVGLVIQEPDPSLGSDGIRARAFLQLPGGTAVFGSLINGSLGLDFGVSYSWRFTYEPSGGTDGSGELLAEVLQGGTSLGTSRIELTAELRAAGVTLDAFGIQNGGSEARSESPNTVSLFVDNVTYTRYSTSRFAGNWIGTTEGGMTALPNGASGIQLTNVTGAIIGGTQPALRNFISGNTQYGIITDGGTAHVIQGNYVGTNLDGTAAIPNATGMSTTAAGIWIGSSHTQIGGGTSGAANVISGNQGYGVRIQGSSATHNRVQGNLIGTNPTGSFAVANGSGVAITGATTSFNIIGVDGDGVHDEFEGNVISGNTSPLTVYTRGLSIEGQENVVAGNKIGTNISGTSAIPNSFGVWLSGTGHRVGTNADGISDTLERNLIAGNQYFGLEIGGNAVGNVVAGNWIGLNAAGNALGNGGGVVVAASHIGVPRNNLIGTNADGVRDELERNVISGNRDFGVRFSGTASDASVSDNTVLAGNFIGTDITGTQARPNIKHGVGGGFTNSGDGIQIWYGYTGAVIGGSHPSARNIISGNQGSGIDIALSSGNVILGNYIGLDVSGALALRNLESGVLVKTTHPWELAVGNQIGGPNPGEGNVISGNAEEGVNIRGLGTTATVLAGNLIGLDAAGDVRIANGTAGVRIANGAHDTIIGGSQPEMGNVISGHTNGIWIDGETGTIRDIGIQGNRIGTNAAGTAAIPNTTGVYISTGGSPWIHDVTVGGTEPDAGNLISGNTSAGIRIVGSRTLGTRIEGNWIGTDVTGQAALPNQRGIVIEESAGGVTIGSIGAGNVISGNAQDGITIHGGGLANTILSNFIGTTADGSTILKNRDGIRVENAAGTRIGGGEEGAGNVIAGNAYNMRLVGVGTHSTVIHGNTIGLDATGREAITLGPRTNTNVRGIQIESGSHQNRIGGLNEGEGNVISGHAEMGIMISGGAGGNTIEGNKVGTDANGTQSLWNLRGIRLDGVPNTQVTGNLISGNHFGLEAAGASHGLVIRGNQVGSNADGTERVPNHTGIRIEGVPGVIIGGTSEGDGNLISGNSSAGIAFVSAHGGVVQGNLIGTDVEGTYALYPDAPISFGSSWGIYALNSADLLIGGGGSAARNVISGVNSAVVIDGPTSINNRVQGNYIGTDINGTAFIGNLGGVSSIYGASFNVIGTDGDGVSDHLEGNVISVSPGEQFAVYLAVNANDNIVAGNLIGTDVTGTVALGAPARAIVRFQGSRNRFGTNADGISDELERNVITGGVFVNLDPLVPSFMDDNVIKGNYIGTDITGTKAFGVGTTGIHVGYTSSPALPLSEGPRRTIIGGTTEVERNLIAGFTQYGIHLAPAVDTVIQGNYIGTDVTGTQRLGNGRGINAFSSPGTIIGGGQPGAGNLISGNDYGIWLMFPQTIGTRIQGNTIGTDVTGKQLLANTFHGIAMLSGVSDSIIGVDGDGIDDEREGNLISGNFDSAVFIQGDRNIVAGNLIGTDRSGQQVIGNGHGVRILTGSHNRVGTNADGISDELERNVIAGGTGYGVGIYAAPGVLTPADSNVVAGNYIGTDITGTLPLGNGSHGVVVAFTHGGPADFLAYPTGNIIGGTQEIERNIISANARHAVYLRHAEETVVQGNYIGTDGTGSVAFPNATILPNAAPAVFIEVGKRNQIGGGADGARNLISGNFGYGVAIHGTGSNDNKVQGNWIGTDASGTVALPNFSGISIGNGLATGNIIGVDGDGIDDEHEGNLISGHVSSTTASTYGIQLSSSHNIIAGNWIGTDVTGTLAIPNSIGLRLSNGSNNRIGTNADGISDYLERNIIAGNLAFGLQVASNSTANVIAGNWIGLNKEGNSLGNVGGILIVEDNSGTPSHNRIGSNGDGVHDDAERNVISGNWDYGVRFVRLQTVSPTAQNNVLAGNYIGTDPSGTVARPNVRFGIGVPFENSGDGVQVWGGATGAVIGGSLPAQRNVIAGNEGSGIDISESSGAIVVGNYIGTDRSGLVALGNQETGITLRSTSTSRNATLTRIGGSSIEEGNLIAGNFQEGIRLEGSRTFSNSIVGNWIGTDVTGRASLGNAGGIHLTLGANQNDVGDSLPGRGNVIGGHSGLTGYGIQVSGAQTSNNRIRGNFIGTDRSGRAAVPNRNGILVQQSATTVIGGELPEQANTIAHNLAAGIRLPDALSASGPTQGNRFYGNLGLAIDVGSPGITLNDAGDGDGFLNFPVLTSARLDGPVLTVAGFARPGGLIDFYLSSPTSNGFGQGQVHLGRFYEGSLDDGDLEQGSYGPGAVAGRIVGSDTTNRFLIDLPVFDLVSHGSLITAVAYGSTSEFSNVVIVGDAGSSLAPVVELGGDEALQQGERLQRSGSFTDDDSTSWTATVDYGDGTLVPLELRGDRTFSLDHQYAQVGTYLVAVTITDNGLAVGQATFQVTVMNEAPTATFNFFTITSPASEGSVVKLRGEFTDPGLEDIHQVEIDWGDGSPVLVQPVPAGDRIFEATHVYLDDDPSGTSRDVYRVQVTVIDNFGGRDSTPIGLFLVDVINVVPSGLSIELSSPEINESDFDFTLSGSFIDPGILDTHRVVIDWGDDSPRTEMDLPAAARSFNNINHVFRNNPDTPDSTYWITIEVSDDDEPLNPARAVVPVIVRNVLPHSIVLHLSETVIDESDTVTLAGSFIDPGILDTHRVRIDWGDGSSVTELSLAAGVTSFSDIIHQYRDNPSSGTTFTITVEIIDDDQPDAPVAAAQLVTVRNVAPTLMTLSSDITGVVFEGQSVSIEGSFADVGVRDRHRVLVTWGDGTTSWASVDSTARTFKATHRYLDDGPSGSAIHDTEIRVEVFDQDGDSDVNLVPVTLANVAPTVTILPGENSTQSHVELIALVTDPGVLDTFEYRWEVFLHGNPFGPIGEQSVYLLDRTGFFKEVFVVRLTVTDDDTGTAQITTALKVGTPQADQIVVTDSDFTALNVAQMIVLGLGDDDILDATAVSADYSVTLDGGPGNDRLFGGSGDDIYILRGGDDMANIALPSDPSPNYAGNDRYYIVPNSTHQVADEEGLNAIDFSLANFGVTFDLGLSGELQDVDPLGDADTHFVSIVGTFSELVGTNYSDLLTADSDATLFGGLGDDTLRVLRADTTNVNLFGGLGDDTFLIQGLNASGLSIFGDDGADLLIVEVPVFDLVFRGGADDDVLQVLSTGFVASLTFFGDDGADLLDIQGPVFDLIFTGGADDDILQVLAGGSITNLIFNGDDGADLLIIDAPVFDLVFSGGADDDVLTVFSGGEVQRLTFRGDDGADLLIIEGLVFDLVFGGGADDDVLQVLSGGSVQSLVFSGDDGADLLQIDGPVFDVVFGGGADDDVLQVLSGGTVESLIFTGDDGADLLLIEGLVFDVVFGGGADDDVLHVLATGSVSSLEFNGDDGADLLIIEGPVFDVVFSGGADNDVLRVLDTGSVNSLVFNGDDGADLLILDGPVFDLVFAGGADDDVLQVLQGASITRLNFQGDDGADLLIIEGPVFDVVFGGGADDDRLLIRETGLVNNLIFTGDDGADLLIVEGPVFDLIFTGGADDDVLRLTAAGSIRNLVFQGDDGADLLILDGPVFDLVFVGGADDDTLRVLSGGTVNTLNFSGDDGADLLVVDGPVFDLIFSGGADDDSLVVLSGPVSHITFYGDVAPELPPSGRDGRDVLLNRASQVQSIRFFAGQAGSVLQNEGAGIGSVALLGGEGRDILINYGNEIGELRLDGGNGANTLINAGDNVYSIVMNGVVTEPNLLYSGRPLNHSEPQQSYGSTASPGPNTLVNYGSVLTGGTAAIRMVGGDDIDVLQNNGAGYTWIEFNGGNGNDVLQNNADGIRNIRFIGGAGTDVLENNGHRVSGIYFDGGDDRDILVNDGHDVSDVVFVSGNGESWLLNTGDRVQRVQLIGGDDRNIMANQGIDVSGFTLLGGDGLDWLVNAGANAHDFLLDGGGGDDWFLNLASASGSRQLQFLSSRGDNRFTNMAGLVDGIRFVGGDGDDFYEDHGWDSSNIEVQFGSGQNNLWLGGGKLSNLDLVGGPRKDFYYLNADYLQNVTIQGQAGNDVVVLNGNYASDIHFIGGAGSDTLAIHGNYAQTVLFDGGDGADRLQVLGHYLNSLTFVGGDGDDAVWLSGSHGRGLLFDAGAGHDTLLILGNHWDDVTFHGGAGMDTMVSSGNWQGTVRFDGGEGADTLRTQGFGLHRLEFLGGSGSDGLVMNHQGGPGSSVYFSGGDGDDVAILRGQADLIEINMDDGEDTILVAASGNMSLDAGPGNDRYIFAGQPSGQVTISEPTAVGEDHSQDMFDFSSWSAGGIVLDLASTEPQWLSPSFSLQLMNSSIIEHVVGTVWSDTLYGNERNNRLLGSQYPHADQQSPTVFASRPSQWVLLDFDTYTQPERGEIQYSAEDRQEIATRIARAYRGDDPERPWFDVRVTSNRQQIPDGVEFATLYFNRTPSFGRPGGEASEIDFRNTNLGGWGAIQINGLLGGLEFSPAPEDDFMEQLPTEGDVSVNGLKPPATRENIIALSTKIAAHELGHLLGLMHADAFGPIGFGIHASPGAGLFKPAFPGPAVAFETFDHLIGSPASIGSNRFNDVRELFFGEREAVKLALAFAAEEQIVQPELVGTRSSLAEAQALQLVGLDVPNTMRRGLHFAKTWHVDAAIVSGNIHLVDGRSESDFYSFAGQAGELMTLEVFSMTLGRLAAQTIDPVLRLYDQHGQLIPYFDGWAENDDQFEGTESRLIDVRLPYTGTYFVEIDTFRRDPGEWVCDANNPDSPLHANNFSLLPEELFDRFVAACHDTDTGGYELLIYRFGTSVDSPDTDILLGREGVDWLETRPFDHYEIALDLGEDWFGQVNELFSRQIDIVDLGGHSWIGQVNYGDGSGWQELVIAASGQFELAHRYLQSGQFIVEVRITNDDGRQVAVQMTTTTFHTNLGTVHGTARIILDSHVWANGDFSEPQVAILKLSVSNIDDDSLPVGQIGLQILGKNFKFEANEFHWLVLDGAHAYLSAIGMLNDQSGYLLTFGVVDEGAGRSRDLVRIQLSTVADGRVIFDTQMGQAETVIPSLSIVGGNIFVNTQGSGHSLAYANIDESPGLYHGKDSFFVQHDHLIESTEPNISRYKEKVNSVVAPYLFNLWTTLDAQATWKASEIPGWSWINDNPPGTRALRPVDLITEVLLELRNNSPKSWDRSSPTRASGHCQRSVDVSVWDKTLTELIEEVLIHNHG